MKVKFNKKQELKIKLIAKKLLIVGDSNRLKLLCLLFSKKTACVSDLADSLKLSVAIVSHHLKNLQKAELLESKRQGKMTYYSLAKNSFIKDLKKLICKYK